VPTPVLRPAYGPDGTAPLPQVDVRGPSSPLDETTPLPQVPDDRAAQAPGGEAAGRVPPGFFRDEPAAPPHAGGIGPMDETHRLPQIDPDAPAPSRARRDWAEETPLDDLPSLADELLGPHDEDDDGRGGRRRR
jgi:dTMP kinase